MSEKNDNQKNSRTNKKTLIGIIILLIIIILFLIGRDYFKSADQALQETAEETAEELTEETTEELTEEQQEQQTEAAVQVQSAEAAENTDSAEVADPVEAAKSAALTHAGLNAEEITFIKVKADGKNEYDIDFVTDDTKYEYEIDTNSGKVKDYDSEPIEQLSLYEKAEGIITPEEAKAAALTALKLEEAEAVLTKIEFDIDDGSYEYDVEYFADNTLYSCEINASTGDTLQIERDNNQITD